MVCKLIMSINSKFNNKFDECINKSIYLKYSHRLKIYRFNVFNTRILDSVVHRKLAPSSPVSITRRYARTSQISILKNKPKQQKIYKNIEKNQTTRSNNLKLNMQHSQVPTRKFPLQLKTKMSHNSQANQFSVFQSVFST